jgi:hypothetical protein
MLKLSRRGFLATVGAASGAVALPAIAASRVAGAIPRVPMSFAVATVDGQPARDAAWIDAQVGEMDLLFGPLGVHPQNAGVRPLAARFARVESRADRDALVTDLRPGVVNVFVVGTLMDVDEPGRTRRGVHWRNRLRPSTRYVILAADAMPTVLAHEMGHYFGNGHTTTRDNLMSYERSGGPVFLDAAQGRVIVAAARQAFESGELVAVTTAATRDASVG